MAGQLPLQVWERARQHLVFTQTALSVLTRSEYGMPKFWGSGFCSNAGTVSRTPQLWEYHSYLLLAAEIIHPFVYAYLGLVQHQGKCLDIYGRKPQGVKVVGDKVYLRQNQNNRAHAVTA